MVYLLSRFCFTYFTYLWPLTFLYKISVCEILKNITGKKKKRQALSGSTLEICEKLYVFLDNVIFLKISGVLL